MKKVQKKALAVGAGIAALAAAAAGTYFFSGKAGAKNRTKVKKWATDAKKEVTKQVGSLEKVTKQTYNKAVDEVSKRYENLKNVDKEELASIVGELKGHWDAIQAELKKAVKPVVKVVKKATSKNTKAPIKKTGKKAK